MSATSSRLALFGVGAVLFAAGITGCGGGDDEESGPLTKDEYIAQADQICADSKTETDALEAEFNSAFDAGDLEGAADVLEEANAIVEDAVADLESLEPPEEDQATIDEFLSLSDQQVEIGGQLADAIREGGDQATVQDIGAQADDLEQQSDAIADDYGLTDCGSAGNA